MAGVFGVGGGYPPLRRGGSRHKIIREIGNLTEFGGPGRQNRGRTGGYPGKVNFDQFGGSPTSSGFREFLRREPPLRQSGDPSGSAVPPRGVRTPVPFPTVTHPPTQEPCGTDDRDLSHGAYRQIRLIIIVAASPAMQE